MKIYQYPDPILSQISKPVNIPLNTGELDLIREMWQSVQKIGVGLAAPQVGVSKQIFIIHLSEDPDLAKTVKSPDMVIINPKIVFNSEVLTEMVEGCLSFPDEYWKIIRPANVNMEFDTIVNFVDFLKNPKVKPIFSKKIIHAKGWLARIVQHEIDHLTGKLFIKMGGEKLKNEKQSNSK